MPLENSEEFSCPYCAAGNTLLVDLTGGSQQKFVVDCGICCAPIIVNLRIHGEEIISVDIKRENE